MLRTNGISPKVYIPVALQIVAAVVLFLFGCDVEGKTLLLTAVGTSAAGFRAGAGDVESVPPAPAQVDPDAGDVRPPATA